MPASGLGAGTALCAELRRVLSSEGKEADCVVLKFGKVLVEILVDDSMLAGTVDE